MKVSLSGLYVGRVSCGSLVIDVDRLQIRRKLTDDDLRPYYDEAVQRVARHQEYFADKSALETALEEVSGSQRAKLSAREPVYPGIWNFKALDLAIDNLLEPGKHTSEMIASKYFYVPRIRVYLPVTESGPFRELLEGKEARASTKAAKGKKEQFAGVLMEIPNDRTKPEAKSSVLHETLHHIIMRYQLASGRLFTSAERFESGEKRLAAETLINEGIVEKLTDKLLEDDLEVLFERRWRDYSMRHQLITMLMIVPSTGGASALATLALTGRLPLPAIALAAVPLAAGRMFYTLYKNSKRKELTQPHAIGEISI